MGCGQCSSGGCGSIKTLTIGDKPNDKSVPGCSSGGCSSGGCTKLNTFDWLSNMDVPMSMKYNVVEVKFKGGRKEYFRNAKSLELHTGDFVVCDMPNGYHIGTVSLQGELVRLQMIKKGIADNDALAVILRVANEKELEKHQVAINRDINTMYRTREICKQLNLNLKLSDVEYQSDNTKATFYYSADDRVDFRELIKLLAGEFKIRIEMRQISLRQEASRIGGIGSCGRELCCSTWLTDFKAIPTAAARYQNLSLNPAKLSGQCGRLKCCLNYELETYIDAIKGIPSVEKPLLTEKGPAAIQKTDIFRRIMWFSYPNDSNWHAVPCETVGQIQKMNAEGIKPMSLEDLVQLADMPVEKATINNDLARLDQKYLSKNKNASNNKKNKKKPRNLTENQPLKNEANPNQKPNVNQRPNQGPRPNGNPQSNQNPRSNQPNAGNPNQGNPTNNRPPLANDQRKTQANPNLNPLRTNPLANPTSSDPNAADRPAGNKNFKNRNKNRNKKNRPNPNGPNPTIPE